MKGLYSLVFYAPNDVVDSICEACFSAGAGKTDKYDRCCLKMPTQTQFRPLAGARPAVGTEMEDTHVDETRVEIAVLKSDLKKTVEAMLAAHPYESVAYNIIPILGIEDFDE